jgi:hypothetical protein
MAARYECYPSLEFIGNYLALQLEQQRDAASAEALRAWSQNDGGLFAQAWVSAVGRQAQWRPLIAKTDHRLLYR